MQDGGLDTDRFVWLLCRFGNSLCALPVDRVIEVMRPLPIEPISGVPHFVRGLCIVRGSPVPVVDAGLLLGGSALIPQRLVTVAVDDRSIALAVEQVIGIRSIDPGTLNALPELLQNLAGDAVQAIRVLDRELVLFLDMVRVIPEALLENLTAAGSS